LSSGELRKVFISRALLRKPKLLILDEPFDGLDDTACTLLGRELGSLVSSGLSIILVTHRQEEIFPWITHVLTVREGLITDQGPREEVLGGSGFTGLYALPDTGTSALNESEHFPLKEPGPAPPAAPVIEFDRVTVEYDGRRVLDNLTWTVRAGENWSILGPNGSGKTTILNLITRENLQSYANSIRVFGVPVDGGQSVWEARQRIGVLTPHLQTRYRKNISALDVILSGFFDSTGLYRRCSREQVKRAEDIALFLGIGHLAGRPFPQLSFGEQRLVLIARAMVKKPAMLILDEPCQGLDPVNRGRVLEAVERIGSITDTNLLYVTHRKDEIPGCITCVLTLPGMDVQRLS
ncbi:MAG: ATP-binding cassette domain-containing protein, partial [Spirochaetales bacterium]